MLNCIGPRGIALIRLDITHERTLRVIYDDQYSSFTQLPWIKDDSACLSIPVGTARLTGENFKL